MARTARDGWTAADMRTDSLLAGAYFDRLVEMHARHRVEPFLTGTGQAITVHERNASCADGCAIHSPTAHALRDARTHWRSDRGIMERICEHGVGHPDPDGLAFARSAAAREAYQVLKQMPDEDAQVCSAAVCDNDRGRTDGHHWRRTTARRIIATAKAQGVHGCDGCCGGRP